MGFSTTRGIETRARRGCASRPPRWYIFGLVALVSVYYLFLLTNGTLQIFGPEMLDKVFDSMLVHLLHGEFDVDPDVMEFEANIINGKTYTYFGVFPALLRLLAVPFTDISQAHLARLSCLGAIVTLVALQLRMLLVVHDSLPAGKRRPEFLAVMVAATLLSGPQVFTLAAARVYDEPILWSAVMAVAFNLIVVRAALARGSLRTQELVWLAILAGLALHTRVPIGVALYIGTILITAWTVLCSDVPEGRRWKLQMHGRVLLTISVLLRDARIWLPIGILGLMGLLQGVINFGRWGSPFAFGTDIRYYALAKMADGGNFDALRNHGLFNLGRVWIGALYYATGLPWLVKGVPPFAEFLRAWYARIEGPPTSPLLTNPLTMFLAGFGVYRLIRGRRPEPRTVSLAIVRLALVGHLAAVLLIFSLGFLTLRYHVDFAGFATLATVLGYRSLCIEAPEGLRKRLSVVGAGLCVTGILCSAYVLVLHKAWSMGVPMDVRLALRPLLPSTYLPVAGPFP
jgi:hypothetical protein